MENRLRDTAEGTRIEALTRDDRAIAKEIGKAMIHDDDYKWHWRVVENWNKDKEEEIMEQLKILDMEDKEYVLVPNDFYGEDDDLMIVLLTAAGNGTKPRHPSNDSG